MSGPVVEVQPVRGGNWYAAAVGVVAMSGCVAPDALPFVPGEREGLLAVEESTGGEALFPPVHAFAWITQGVQRMPHEGAPIPLTARKLAMVQAWLWSKAGAVPDTVVADVNGVSVGLRPLRPVIEFGISFRGDNWTGGMSMDTLAGVLPDSLAQGSPGLSFNGWVDASLVGRGMAVTVRAEYSSAVELVVGTDTLAASSSPSWSLDVPDVVTVPPLRILVQPTHAEVDSMNAEVDSLAAALTTGNLEPWVQMFPAPSWELDLAEPVQAFGYDDLRALEEAHVQSGDGRTMLALVHQHANTGDRFCPPGLSFSCAGWAPLGHPFAFSTVYCRLDGSRKWCRGTETIVHELGHSLGLHHAPDAMVLANRAGYDADYPYQWGSIGVWGWSFHGGYWYDGVMMSHSPMGPFSPEVGYCGPTPWATGSDGWRCSAHTWDFMGYENITEWISDYHYLKLLDRMRTGADVAGPWRGEIVVDPISERRALAELQTTRKDRAPS